MIINILTVKKSILKTSFFFCFSNYTCGIFSVWAKQFYYLSVFYFADEIYPHIADICFIFLRGQYIWRYICVYGVIDGPFTLLMRLSILLPLQSTLRRSVIVFHRIVFCQKASCFRTVFLSLPLFIICIFHFIYSYLYFYL